MREILPKTLLDLAENCKNPLYVVGGSVRDHLAKLLQKRGERDFDLCSPTPVEAFMESAQKAGLSSKRRLKTQAR